MISEPSAMDSGPGFGRLMSVDSQVGIARDRNVQIARKIYANISQSYKRVSLDLATLFNQ
jgi:hypothetical protein